MITMTTSLLIPISMQMHVRMLHAWKNVPEISDGGGSGNDRIRLNLLNCQLIPNLLRACVVGTLILNMIGVVKGEGDMTLMTAPGIHTDSYMDMMMVDVVDNDDDSSINNKNGTSGGGSTTLFTENNPPILDDDYVSDVVSSNENGSLSGGGAAVSILSAGFSPGENPPAENQTWTLPIYMRFNEGNVISIVFYSILMCVSAVGNITVLATIVRLRMKARLNRVNLFLLHLAIADLIVTFMLMPLEIGWASTVSWRAGNAVCRIMSFFRIFGLYLSGFILVCISLDRYFAVLKPLALPEANKRGRIMLYVAWSGSIFCSFPQAVIFHVERHPKAQWYEQCVTFNFFSSPTTELAYLVFSFIFLYGFPLVMIISCYTCILYEIFKINNLNRGGENLRRSNMGALGRAKIRTLKMTVVIVATFAMLWMPYNCMSIWYWIDKDSAMQVDQRVQKGLFIFACTNSCFNPMVYGLFHIRQKKPEATRLSNNGRLQRIDKAPYKVRVRWRPRAECLCATSSSQMNSSSVGGAGRMGLRPMCEVNGRQVYLNGQNSCLQQQNIANNLQTPIQRSLTKSTSLHINTRYGNGNPGAVIVNGTKTVGSGGGLTKRNNINAPRKSRRVKFVNLATSTYHNKEFILNGTNFHHPDSCPTGGGGGGGVGGGDGMVGGMDIKNNVTNGQLIFSNLVHHNNRNSSSSYHSMPMSSGSKSNSSASLASLQSPDEIVHMEPRGGLLKYFPGQQPQQQVQQKLAEHDEYDDPCTTFVVQKNKL